MTIDILDDPSPESGYVRSNPLRFPFFPFFSFFPVRLGRRWGAAACLLALGLALTLGAGAAEAQIIPPINPQPPVSPPSTTPSVVKLVSNTGRLDEATFQNFTADYAQAFTTGSNALGFRLTRVDIPARHDSGTVPTISVSIHSVNASGFPGSSLGTLTRQGSWPSTAGSVQFTASGDGIELAANTGYFVVVDSSTAINTIGIFETQSDAEDSGSAAGWSISDGYRWRSAGASSWSISNIDNDSVLMEVHGHPKDSTGGTVTVTGNTLALTFGVNIKRVFVPGGLAKHFTVKVDGRKVPVTGVSISGKTVNLTLARPAGRNQAVTVSYNNAGTPLQSTSGRPVSAFTDLTVENLSSNNAPVFEGTDPTPHNASAETLLSERADPDDFTDIDDDPLVLSFSVDRDNVLHTGQRGNINMGPTGLLWVSSQKRLYFAMKTVCGLSNVKPALPSPFETVITVTATDPTGAAGHVDIPITTTFSGCHSLSSATVTDRTLTLTYDQALPDGWSPAADEFEVKVAGNVVPLVDTDDAVSVSGSTVTLTLAEAVGAGQDVKASHTPGDNPSTVGFTDQAVTVNSANRAPTVTPKNPYNAPLGFPVYVPVEDADDDRFPADHPTAAGLKLHVTWTTDRPDVLNAEAENIGYLDGTGSFYLQMPGECELAKVDPPLPTPLFETTVEIEAMDPTGAVARGTVLAKTAWDGGDECPEFAAAVTNGNELTLSFSRDLDEASTPSKDRFTVKSDGTEVALANPDPGADPPVVPVLVSGNTVVLTLAKEISAGRRVTVSYRPPNFGGIQDAGAGAYAAAGFTDEPVVNVSGDTRSPVLRGAWVEGTTLTLVYDETLHPLRKTGPDWYQVTEVPEPGTNARPIDVTGNEVDGKRVVLTLDTAVKPELELRLTYTVPPGDRINRIQDLAGNLAATFGIGNDKLIVRHGPPPPESPVTPPSGGGGPVGGGSPGDTAPDFGTATVASLTLARGEAMDPVVLPAATGGDGELTYTLASAPAGLAGLSFNAATRRLSGTPDTAGEYEFTYTVHDADANRADTDAAVLTFTVTVEDPRTAQVRQSVRRTLAAVARRSLTSALDNIGARFAASVPASGLTLAGHAVPLGTAAGTGLTDMNEGQFCLPGSSGSSGLPGATDGFGAAQENCAFVTRGMTGEELLHASAFTLSLGAAGGAENTGNTGTGAPSAPQWAVWGRGDLGTFAGRPEPGMGYEGELRTGWLGVDARSGAWVAGLALSHGTGEADYDFAAGGVSGQGRLETSLTALYPYGRWTLSEGLELRGVLGAGSGEARHRLDGDAGERSDLSMWMGSLGLRREFPSLGEIDLAARADASLARMETDDGPAHIANLSADSWRLRAGLEASRRFALDGDAALEPFVEAAARRDGGDGLEGTGLEIAGGLRYTAPRLHVEMRGRWLASHSEEGAEESGVSVTARLGPGAQGRGLSLSLSPRWGAGTGGAEALWRDELPGPAGTGGTAAMDARIGYGFSWAPYGLDGWNGLLTPFAETGISGLSGKSGEDSRRLRLGARFEASRMNLGVELAGERRENGTNEPEHALRLDLGLRF